MYIFATNYKSQDIFSTVKCTHSELAVTPHIGIQSTKELQAATSVITNVQQSDSSQQPIQFQTTAGPVQPLYGNLGQQQYYMYIENPHQEYVQNPDKTANANPPTQPYPTSFTPQLYGGIVLSTPQQVCVISVVLINNYTYQ